MKSILFNHCKILLLSISCFCFYFKAIAQAPANDNCSGAILLTSSSSCISTTGTFIGATPSSPLVATVYSYPYPNTLSFTCPTGVKTAKVECWGGGAAGGAATVKPSAGGSGGGGAYTVNNLLSLTSGTIYPITVGGGAVCFNLLNGQDGLPSAFAGLVTANGGLGGKAGISGSPLGLGGIGGLGGTYTGGNGATANSSFSGGGGGGAGSTSNGGNGSAGSAGIAGTPDGGIGGASVSSSSDGNAGANYGGGGSGASRAANATKNGGSGGDGFVRVTAYYGDVNSPDVWYSFVAASVNPTISLNNIGSDLSTKTPYIQLFSGSCGSQTQVAFSATNNLTASGLSIGATYYIRITTNTSFSTPIIGNYNFDICVQDAVVVPTSGVDYSKSYINVTDGTTGGTINQGDVLEIRATLVVFSGTSLSNVSFSDTIKANAGFNLLTNLIATRTNEGKIFQAFSDANDADAGTRGLNGSDATIKINIGTGATSSAGGSLTNTSQPSLFGSTCVIMATYRVTVDTGSVGYGRKIMYGGGAFKYYIGSTLYTIIFPRDSLIVYPTLAACSDAVAPSNLIASANNGTFGSLTTGSSAVGTQNGGAASINTTYAYTTFSSNSPGDYFYGVANNTSATNATDRTVPKGTGSSRVFSQWDITGDHTGAANTAKGNKPCDPSKPVSTTNPCGYMLTVNSSYRTDKVFEYDASGICSETYYEVSAWFKNLCYKCGCDVTGTPSGAAGYIPTAIGDSSGVRPNIAIQINGIDYYTTGDILYQGLGSTQTASDTLNNWVRRSFVFKTGVNQTSFKVTFRNNAPGGGGNDWAVDDIGLRTCYPTMIYAPYNPIVYMGNSLTITDTVRSYFNSYTFYKWQRQASNAPSGPASAWADIPGETGIATPTLNPIYGQYEYTRPYTILGIATLAANAGDAYRMVVASNALNLANGCNFVSSTIFTLLPTNATCKTAGDTNYAVAPQTGYINWNNLGWSRGHVPTCCESAQITYTGTNASADAVTVDITNDICIINLTLINSSTKSSQLFKTILHPGYNMQMNGNVRMAAPGTAATDSCIFIAQGGGTITVNGNTVIGYPSDNATSIIGTFPGTTSYANYYLKGDSLTFNTKSFTNHKYTSVTLDPISGAAVVVNNSDASTYPNAVTFDVLKIGNTTAKTVTTAGTNQNAFMNDNNGNLEVTAGSTLIMPANYSINAKDFTTTGTYKNNLYLRSNSNLILGGITGGITGSNFPANFSSFNLDATSTVQFNGASQSIPGTINNVNAYGNITLTGTGVKTGSNSNINLAGNLYRTNGGHTYNSNLGRVTFTSSINAQRYYADAGATSINFYDLTNNNTYTSGVSIDSTIGVLDELELKVGTNTTLNTGDVIMRSTASGTSHISNLGTTIPSIIYNSTYRFVIERYLFGQKSWRFLSTPVDINTSPTIATAWREGNLSLTSTGYGTQITGPTGPTTATAGGELDFKTQRGSMKYYNDAGNAFTELSNTTTTKIANTQGYMVFVRGDRGAPNTTAGAGTITNLRIKGQIRTGNQVFSVLANKFQSIGNPYASQINFGSLTKTLIADAFYVWKPSLLGLYGVGGYENYVFVSPNYRLNANPSGTIKNTIESGEAFFVQNAALTVGAVTIKESDKGILSNILSRTANNGIVVPTFVISLFEKNASDSSILVDGVSTSFDNSFSSGLDNDDVIKFTNTNDNLFIKSNNKNLVVERRPIPTISDTIKLGITGTRAAAYRFQIDPYLLGRSNLNAFLVDKYLQTETALSLFDSSNINFNITGVAASSSADRFMIIFKPLEPTIINSILAFRNQDKTATVKWETKGEKNVDKYIIEQSIDGINFKSIGTQEPVANDGTNTNYNKIDATATKAKNWYRIKAINRAGSIVYSEVAMVTEIIEPTISVYPNPVIGGKINLYLKNQPAGIYTIQISNKSGQILKTEALKISNNNELQIINLSAAVEGTYQLKITSSTGVNTTLSVLVK